MRVVPWAFAAVFAACAGVPAQQQSASPPGQANPSTSATQQQALVPPGHGTLRQDEVTVSLRRGPLLLKVTPLAESVIRLLAPDTYDRLHALAESRRGEAAAAAPAPEPPELFLVSFFSYDPDIEFQPEDVRLTHQGRQLRAVTILPVTSGFGRQRLQQQESQSAIYVFDARIAYDQPIIVQYATDQSADWTRVIPKLEVERSKARSRAGNGG
jgi:hypothetical protein